MIEALERLMKGRTVITIAHRLSTIRDADKIIVIEGRRGGREQGTHDELMALEWHLRRAASRPVRCRVGEAST